MYSLYFNYDVPTQSFSWQDMASPLGEEIMYFHDIVMFILVSTSILVFYAIYSSVRRGLFSIRSMNHGFITEIIWTISPAIVLICLAFPSFRLLYLMDDLIDSEIVVKAIGHQWYWCYEISDYNTISPVEFESYMIPTDDLVLGSFRLLEVDNRLVLPINLAIRLMISASDVLHSWAVPSLGIKVDAIPGRLNSATMFINRPGLFFGQCSELCGVNHAFMPIVIEGVSINDYLVHLESY